MVELYSTRSLLSNKKNLFLIEASMDDSLDIRICVFIVLSFKIHRICHRYSKILFRPFRFY